jgi:hypothetical protein
MVKRVCHFSMNDQLSRALFVAQGPGYAIKRKSDTLITWAKLEEIEELRKLISEITNIIHQAIER